MKKNILIALVGGAVILAVGFYVGRSEAALSLHEAAQQGNADLIIKLVQDGLDVNQPNLEGQTPLMLAAQADENSVAVINLLLTQGAHVNAADQYGNTALIYAAQKGDLDAVKTLVEHGADAAIENKSGATALDFAEGDEHFFVTEYLEQVLGADHKRVVL